MAAALFVSGLLIPGGGAMAAAQFSIAPLLLNLPADKLAASLTLGNQGGEPVAVQTELVSWTQDKGDDAYAPATGLVVSPAIFTLAPAAQQLVRIGRLKRSAAPAREQAYRIRLAEIPPAGRESTQEVSTVMQLSLPMFVPPADRKARAQLSASAKVNNGKDLVLTLGNAGALHDKVTHMQVLQDGAVIAERALNYYVLAGAQRDLAWPAALASAKPGKLELRIQLYGHNRTLVQSIDFVAEPAAPAESPKP